MNGLAVVFYKERFQLPAAPNCGHIIQMQTYHYVSYTTHHVMGYKIMFVQLLVDYFIAKMLSELEYK